MFPILGYLLPNIQRYINYCRKRHSVLEPTLSAMYQLNMYDSDVICKLDMLPSNIFNNASNRM